MLKDITIFEVAKRLVLWGFMVEIETISLAVDFPLERTELIFSKQQKIILILPFSKSSVWLTIERPQLKPGCFCWLWYVLNVNLCEFQKSNYLRSRKPQWTIYRLGFRALIDLSIARAKWDWRSMHTKKICCCTKIALSFLLQGLLLKVISNMAIYLVDVMYTEK